MALPKDPLPVHMSPGLLAKKPRALRSQKLLLRPAFSKAHRSDKMKRDCSIIGLAANGFKAAVTQIFVTWVARGFSQAQTGLSPG